MKIKGNVLNVVMAPHVDCETQIVSIMQTLVKYIEQKSSHYAK